MSPGWNSVICAMDRPRPAAFLRWRASAARCLRIRATGLGESSVFVISSSCCGLRARCGACGCVLRRCGGRTTDRGGAGRLEVTARSSLTRACGRGAVRRGGGAGRRRGGGGGVLRGRGGAGRRDMGESWCGCFASIDVEPCHEIAHVVPAVPASLEHSNPIKSATYDINLPFAHGSIRSKTDPKLSIQVFVFPRVVALCSSRWAPSRSSSWPSPGF